MVNPQVNYVVQPGGVPVGNLRVPGDKSISHRALMLGALAEGTTTIEGFLESEDTLATRRALAQMGVSIESTGQAEVRVNGRGRYGLAAPGTALDLGNSGTSVRLMAGLLCGQAFDSCMIGDDSLMKRPMLRVVTPLREMGAKIECSEQGTLPLNISGHRQLRGIDYHLPVASAQLKSAVLLAGLYASGQTSVHEPAPTRDHSERMLSHFGCELENRGGQISLKSVRLVAQHVIVPADISSAAFFMVAASVIPGSDLLLEAVGVNPTRNAVIDILQLMGADIEVENRREHSCEPVADIRVRQRKLQGIVIPREKIAMAIDELPVLMIAAACAEGTTRLRGAGELRVKESDRIAAMCEGLQRLGIAVEEYRDGMQVQGGRISGPAKINSFGDHRIAMAFAVAGLLASAPLTILDCANVNTSFPGFSRCFADLGLDLAVRQQDHG